MNRKLLIATVTALSLTAVAGCAQHSDPQALADQATRGVYNVDYDTTTANFDDSLKTQVTRSSIGDLSDKMHTLGAYHGLKAAGSDPDKGRYDYQAAFDKGTMLIQMRVDPNWKIGAYRVVPEAATATTPPSSS